MKGLYIFVSIAVLFIVAGCSGNDGTIDFLGDQNECQIGQEQCSCTAGGGCDPGLTCLSELCVAVNPQDTDSAGGGGDSDQVVGSDNTTDTSGDSDSGVSGDTSDSSDTSDDSESEQVSQDEFSIVDGYLTIGEWHGYAWSSASKGCSISPSSYTTFTGDGPMCVTGSVTASYESTALVGFNIAQELGSSKLGTYTPTSEGLMVDVTTNKDSPLRVQIQGPDGETDKNDRWCADISVKGGELIPWTSFNTLCGDPSNGTFYKNEPIAAVMIMVPGTPDGAISFDFCFNNVTP
ncbi:MAG: hypothetical protein JXR91_01180 [Deltaproteobacteria bacterium]|nr:hypothetical protein [Deltaproteobacteria bacterium]